MIDKDYALEQLDTYEKPIVFTIPGLQFQVASSLLVEELGGEVRCSEGPTIALRDKLLEEIAHACKQHRDVIIMGASVTGTLSKILPPYDGYTALVITNFLTPPVIKGWITNVYIAQGRNLSGRAGELSSNYGCVDFLLDYRKECKGKEEMSELVLYALIQENLRDLAPVKKKYGIGEGELCILKELPSLQALVQSVPIAFNACVREEGNVRKISSLKEMLKSKDIDPAAPVEPTGLEEVVFDELKVEEEKVSLPPGIYSNSTFIHEASIDRNLKWRIEQGTSLTPEMKDYILRKLGDFTRRSLHLNATRIGRGYWYCVLRKDVWKDCAYFFLDRDEMLVSSYATPGIPDLERRNEVERENEVEIRMKPEEDRKAWKVAYKTWESARGWFAGDYSFSYSLSKAGPFSFEPDARLPLLDQFRPLVTKRRKGEEIEVTIRYPPIPRFKGEMRLVAKELASAGFSPSSGPYTIALRVRQNRFSDLEKMLSTII